MPMRTLGPKGDGVWCPTSPRKRNVIEIFAHYPVLQEEASNGAFINFSVDPKEGGGGGGGGGGVVRS